MTAIQSPPVTTDATPTQPGRGRKAKNKSQPPKRAKDGTSLLGREPRVDLLPTEVHVHRKQRAGVRRAWLAVVIVAAIVAAGVAGATTVNLRATAELETAQSETTSLLAQKREFSELQNTVAEAARLKAAQKVGGSTEIDWSDYLDSVQKSLPAGVTITSVTADSATAVAPYAQSTSALQGARIGTLTFTASSPTLPKVPDWLDSLRSLPGFVDGTANSVSLADTTGGAYTASLTLHIDEGAYDNRYTGKEK